MTATPKQVADVQEALGCTKWTDSRLYEWCDSRKHRGMTPWTDRGCAFAVAAADAATNDHGQPPADTEQAALVARVAELEARLDAVRLTRDYFGEQAAENGLRADAAEATLAKVAALADEWQADYPGPGASWHGTPDEFWRDLRAALASAGRPATTDGEDASCTCPWTDESTWTRYGSAAEPGSQREYDPGCIEHGEPTDGEDATSDTPAKLPVIRPESSSRQMHVVTDRRKDRPASPVVAPSATDETPRYSCGHTYGEPGCGWPCCGYPDLPATDDGAGEATP